LTVLGAPFSRKAFGLTQEQAESTKVLAANQGLYNGFLAVGLIWGLSLGEAGVHIQLLFLGLSWSGGPEPLRRIQSGGGVKPRPRPSSSCAKRIVVRSSNGAPMTCTFTGRPCGVRPTGALVAGRPSSVAGAIHMNWSP
jgi:hypothetical protein